jgi:hypothetical protein
MNLTLTEQLLYTIEQRIAKISLYKDEYGLEDPYLWYVSQSGGHFIKYTIECLKTVPFSYNSKTGFIIDFDITTDNVHSVLYEIVDTEMKQADFAGIIEGSLHTEEQSNGFVLYLDLTGN